MYLTNELYSNRCDDHCTRHIFRRARAVEVGTLVQTRIRRQTGAHVTGVRVPRADTGRTSHHCFLSPGAGGGEPRRRVGFFWPRRPLSSEHCCYHCIRGVRRAAVIAVIVAVRYNVNNESVRKREGRRHFSSGRESCRLRLDRIHRRRLQSLLLNRIVITTVVV